MKTIIVLKELVAGPNATWINRLVAFILGIVLFYVFGEVIVDVAVIIAGAWVIFGAKVTAIPHTLATLLNRKEQH